jgi:DNA-binding IclR family transcriptional regulator
MTSLRTGIMDDMQAPDGTGSESATTSPRIASNLSRAMDILRCIGRSAGSGLRLQELIERTGLAKATAHRLLGELVSLELVEYDTASSRYHLSFGLFLLGSVAANRFNIVELAKSALIRLAELTEDTVYLTVRSRYESVCVDRIEGAYPLKALTTEVGMKQPLGLGAGSIALLMPLDEREVTQIIDANRAALQAHPAFDLISLRETLRQARATGYVYRASTRVAEIGSIAMPVIGTTGTAVAAITISAVESRFDPDRRASIVAAMNEHIGVLQRQFIV